jgi:transposase
MRKRRQFDVSYKQSLVNEINSGQRTLLQVSRDEGIAHSVLERWQEKADAGTLQEAPTPRERKLERELDRYKKKVGELTMQVELLKKLDASLARMRKSNGYVVTGMNTVVSGKDVH